MPAAPSPRFINSLHLLNLFLFFIIADAASPSRDQHVALVAGSRAIFNCSVVDKPAIWTKIVDDGSASASVQYIYIGRKLYDEGLKDKFKLRYTPSTKEKPSQAYDLVIESVSLADSGKYLCSEDRAVFLTVVEPPSCTPTKNVFKENVEVVFKCKAKYSGLFGAPTLDWTRDDVVLYTNPSAGVAGVKSVVLDDATVVKTLEWKPRSEHNGANVTCVVKHPHLTDGKGNPAAPSCGYIPLDVRFRPRVICPHSFFVPQDWMAERDDGKNLGDVTLAPEKESEEKVKTARHHSKRAVDLRRRAKMLRRHPRLSSKKRTHFLKRFRRTDSPATPTSPVNYRESEHFDGPTFSCDVHANPLPGDHSMYWKLEDGEKIFVGSPDPRQSVISQSGDHLRAAFRIPVSELSESLPQMRVTLSVPLHGRSMMDTVTDVHYVFGPYLSCPPHVYLSNKGPTRGADLGSGSGVSGGKTFLVKCRVRIHPPLDEGNVSWTLDGDRVSPVNSYVQTPLPPLGRSGSKRGGGMPISTDEDEQGLTLVMLKVKEYQVQDREAEYMLKLHVRGAHNHATSTIRIRWEARNGVAEDEDVEHSRAGAARDRDLLPGWILDHAVVLVASGVLLAAGLLFGILLLVLYRQGCICPAKKSKKAKPRQGGGKKDKDRLSKAFPELFHSHRGHQRGHGDGGHSRGGRSQAPPIGLIAHHPRERSGSQSTNATPQHLVVPAGGCVPPPPPPREGGRSRSAGARTPEGGVDVATMERMTGLAKLGNALYLKDMDQDGFLACEDARSVLESYNGVYRLGLDDARMTELLRLSSNGNYVDIEAIMRLLVAGSQTA